MLNFFFLKSMKTASSSSRCYFILLAILLLITCAASLLGNSSPRYACPCHCRQHREIDEKRSHRAASVLPHQSPRPCFKPVLVEVDGKFGVDKRLVPGGPNPLHNKDILHWCITHLLQVQLWLICNVQNPISFCFYFSRCRVVFLSWWFMMNKELSICSWWMDTTFNKIMPL